MTTAPETAISRRAGKGAAEELTFLYMNRNKRSLTLDLQAPYDSPTSFAVSDDPHGNARICR